MLRKLMLVAVAAAAPIGLIAVAGTASASKAPPVNATNNTVTCTSLKGTVTFSPAVTTDESAGSDTDCSRRHVLQVHDERCRAHSDERQGHGNADW